jgi:FixJ family two-component response regulator
MTNPRPIVYIVDDEPGVRKSLSSLVRSAGLEVRTFAGGVEFLESKREDAPECLVLDVQMPGVSGLDLQNQLVQLPFPIPVIFITGHGDIPMAVRVMKAGALEFLTKPLHDQDLLGAIYRAIRHSSAARRRQADLAALRARFASLTPREGEVMEGVVEGLLNKQIAAQFGTSEKTVKVHRGQVMRKMQARSLPDLVRMAQRLAIRALSHRSVAPDTSRLEHFS